MLLPLFTASQENSSWTMRKCRRAVNLADNQANGARCGDNGIFKGLPVTKEQKTLSQIARDIFSVYSYDGKCILDGNRLILCQSNVPRMRFGRSIPVWQSPFWVNGRAAIRMARSCPRRIVSVNIYAFLKAHTASASCSFG